MTTGTPDIDLTERIPAMTRIATLPTASKIKKTAVVITPQRQAGTVPTRTAELGYKGRGMAGR